MRGRRKTSAAANHDHHVQYHYSDYHEGMKGAKTTPLSNTLLVCLSSFMMMIIIAMNYLIYFDQFLFLLLMMAIIGALLHFLKLIYQIFDILDNSYRYQDSIDPVLGLVLAAILGWLVGVIADAMPMGILVLAEQFVAGSNHPQTLKLWQYYNGTEHRVILQSMCATLFLLIGLVSNLLYGLMKLKRWSPLISAIAILLAYLLVCLYT
ncbi:hypothetical protein KTI13_10885 [Acinetobacter courvalinii]|nr:hypothetical protein [Acinetobacter courvalinii]MCU4447032.1 hypothetical protein [Acinetobacter courvalinii]